MAQKTTNGKSTASGACGVSSHSGNNDTISIYVKNCGIGKEQGAKIIELLNKVLANQDISTVNAKLDELLEVASKPVQTQNCFGSNCFQGTNYGGVEDFGPPKLAMTDAQRDSITDAMKKFFRRDRDCGM